MENIITLSSCSHPWGDVEVRHGSPNIIWFEHCTFVPFTEGDWGLFDRNGAVINEARDRRGPDGTYEVQPDSWFGNTAFDSTDTIYLYAGRIHVHFGHFLINSLARLWPLLNSLPVRPKILYHGVEDITALFGLSFIRDLFEALDLKESDFVVLTEPTCLGMVMVPEPSIQEQQFVYDVYGELTRHIGQKIIGHDELHQDPLPPIYLSKTGLQSGVGRLVNEDKLEAVLLAAGVEIAHPETLSIYDQLKCFSQGRTVIGTIGSAFHLAAFVKPTGLMILLCPTENPNSNYLLLDAISGLNSNYLHLNGTQVQATDDDTFLTNYVMPHPERAAQDILTYLAHVSVIKTVPNEQSFFLCDNMGRLLQVSKTGDVIFSALSGDCLPVVGWLPNSTVERIFLYSYGQLDRLVIEDDHLTGAVLSYIVERRYGSFVSLTHPSTERVLALKDELGDDCRVSFSADDQDRPAVLSLLKMLVPETLAVSALCKADKDRLGLLAPETILQLQKELLPSTMASLLRLLTVDALRAMVAKLAEDGGYNTLFPYLRQHLGRQERLLWGGTTDVALEFWINNCNYKVGEHTYGAPQIWSGLLHKEETNLSIGKYCAIAGNIDLVMASHHTKWASIYPFVIYRDFWPGIDGTYSDHIAKPVVIGNDVWIGAHACILPGMKINDGAVVGAYSVVTTDVPAYAIAAGNPARIVGYRFEPSVIDRLLTLKWWDWPDWKVDKFLPLMMSNDIERFLAAAESVDKNAVEDSRLGTSASLIESADEESPYFSNTPSAPKVDKVSDFFKNFLKGILRNRDVHT